MNMLNRLSKEIGAYSDAFLCYFPGELGYFLRYIIYKRRFKSCGKKISIPQAVFFKTFGKWLDGPDPS